MNRIDQHLWPIVEPPPGFAERVVDRMLTQGKVVALEPARRHRGLKVAGLLLAAIFISGAAFGYAARSMQLGSRAASGALPLSNQSFSSMQQRLIRVTTPRLAPVKVTTARAVPKAFEQDAPVPPPSASASSPSHPIPRVPACQCQRGFADVICDCY